MTNNDWKAKLPTPKEFCDYALKLARDLAGGLKKSFGEISDDYQARRTKPESTHSHTKEKTENHKTNHKAKKHTDKNH